MIHRSGLPSGLDALKLPDIGPVYGTRLGRSHSLYVTRPEPGNRYFGGAPTAASTRSVAAVMASVMIRCVSSSRPSPHPCQTDAAS